jgi:hypothetical protein
MRTIFIGGMVGTCRTESERDGGKEREEGWREGERRERERRENSERGREKRE